MKFARILQVVGLIAVTLAVFGRPTSSADAATFVVNTDLDAVDASPGDAHCATADGACTLRAAIQEANALGGPHVITIDSAIPYLSLDIDGPDEDQAATGDLDVRAEITLVGQPPTADDRPPVIASSQIADRVFEIHEGASLTVQLVETFGDQGSHGLSLDGAAYLNHGALTFDNSDTLTNVSWGIAAEFETTGDGGAIYNAEGATLRILSRVARSWIHMSWNVATHGGGIYNAGEAVLSGLADGSADVYVDSGTAELGAGVFNAGNLLMECRTYARFTQEPYSSQGGGIYNAAGATYTQRGGGWHNNHAEVGGALYNAGTFNAEPCGAETVDPRYNSASIGGAMYNAGRATLDTIAFGGNTADFGGAYAQTGGEESLPRTAMTGDITFYENTAALAGGAMALTGGTFEGPDQATSHADPWIRAERNTATNGGAFYVDGPDTYFTVSNMVLRDNRAATALRKSETTTDAGLDDRGDAKSEIRLDENTGDQNQNPAKTPSGSRITATDSTPRAAADSRGAGAGGAVYLHRSQMIVESLAAIGNAATGNGGAFAVSGDASLALVNATFAGNGASVGSSVDVDGPDATAHLAQATLVDVSKSALSATDADTLHLHYSLVDSQEGTGCAGPVHTDSANVFSDSSCPSGPSDLVDNAAARWSPWDDVIELDTGNPAIDFLPACAASDDQRFRPRPQDGDGDGDPRCDAGAIEMETRLSSGDVRIVRGTVRVPEGGALGTICVLGATADGPAALAIAEADGTYALRLLEGEYGIGFVPCTPSADAIDTTSPWLPEWYGDTLLDARTFRPDPSTEMLRVDADRFGVDGCLADGPGAEVPCETATPTTMPTTTTTAPSATPTTTAPGSTPSATTPPTGLLPNQTETSAPSAVTDVAIPTYTRGVVTERPSNDSILPEFLASTGSSIVSTLTLAGIGLFALGTLLMVVAKRRQDSTEA